MSDILKVCMTCRPGVRELPGLVLTHGYCRKHGLEWAEQSNLIEWHERVELFVRRHWLGLLVVAALLAASILKARTMRAVSPTLACGPAMMRASGLFSGSVKVVGRARRVAPASAATEDRVKIPTPGSC